MNWNQQDDGWDRALLKAIRNPDWIWWIQQRKWDLWTWRKNEPDRTTFELECLDVLMLDQTFQSRCIDGTQWTQGEPTSTNLSNKGIFDQSFLQIGCSIFHNDNVECFRSQLCCCLEILKFLDLLTLEVWPTIWIFFLFSDHLFLLCFDAHCPMAMSRWMGFQLPVHQERNRQSLNSQILKEFVLCSQFKLAEKSKRWWHCWAASKP